MGRRAYLLRRLGPCFAAALVLPRSSPARGPRADPTLATRLDARPGVPNVDPSRTAALAVDLRTGAVVYARNESLVAHPRLEPEAPRSPTRRSRCSARAIASTPRSSAAARSSGDVWHGDLVAAGLRRPDAEPADLDALAGDVAAWGIRRVDGAVLGDESWFDARRVGPGWKPSFYIEESPPLSALVVDRGATGAARLRTRPSRRRRSSGEAARASGVDASPARTRTGVLTSAGLPLARDVSEPLADDRPVHGPRERQLHGGDAR